MLISALFAIRINTKSITKSSFLGNYAIVIGHNAETKKTRVRLPSGAKKIIPSSNRAMVGMSIESL
jgi:ribosomal protein L2